MFLIPDNETFICRVLHLCAIVNIYVCHCAWSSPFAWLAGWGWSFLRSTCHFTFQFISNHFPNDFKKIQNQNWSLKTCKLYWLFCFWPLHLPTSTTLARVLLCLASLLATLIIFLCRLEHVQFWNITNCCVLSTWLIFPLPPPGNTAEPQQKWLPFKREPCIPLFPFWVSPDPTSSLSHV